MLIIYAHPNKKGHCGYILNEIKNELAQKNIAYELLDLYAMDYDPRLKDEEHYTSGSRALSPENRKIQEKVRDASKLIILYPTWWNSPPAILKGFFDRIFVSRFAFTYRYGIPFGLLKGKRASVITTCGGPKIIERLFFGNRSIKLVTKDALRFCGIKAKGFVLGRALQLTDKNKKKATCIVKKSLRYLNIS